MAERDPRAPRIRPVRTVNHVRPDYGGNVNVAGYDDSGLVDRVTDLEGRTAGHVIRDEGDDLPQRPWLDFVGEGVTVTDLGGVTRVSIPGTEGAGGGFGNWIDVFEGITGDTVTEFLLSYPPLDWSWNVTLNGIGLVDDTVATAGDFTLDDTGLLTVTDATALFNGASETDPWTLQVQYERLSGIPAGTPVPEPPGEPSPPELVDSQVIATTDDTIEFTLSGEPVGGDLMVVTYVATHTFPINTADGWEEWHYATPGSTQAVAAKFIDTETAGSVVAPTTGGAGGAVRATLAVVRFIDPTDPLHALDTDGTFTTDAERYALFSACTITGDEPVIDRGTLRDTTAASAGAGGTALADETVPAGADTVSATGTGPFVTSVLLNAQP